ncbi:MAG: hypothetical protein OER96_13030, partial [Gammaproteobacteria bacterium]|nr:hypothetical protein [Gammaproteobacteria bacterium]
LWLSVEDSAPELLTTLGAELSNASWQRETISLAPGWCGVISLEFRSRFAGTRDTRFEIGAATLERVTPVAERCSALQKPAFNTSCTVKR